MKFNPVFFRLLNIFARLFGLMFTAAGLYFVAQGVYYLIYPEINHTGSALSLPPSFRPFLIAPVLLIIGVHFIRGEAHRPDILKEKKPNHSTAGRTHSWWTGEPLSKQQDHNK